MLETLSRQRKTLNNLTDMYQHKFLKSRYIFHYCLNYVPLVFHLQVELGREVLGLLGNVSEIHDLVVQICPEENTHWL